MPSRRLRVLVVLLLAVQVSAASARGSNALQAWPTRVSRYGGIIHSRVVGGGTYGYSAELERRRGGKWMTIGILVSCEMPCAESSLSPPDTPVPTVAVPIFSGDPAPVLLYRLPRLPAGTYRLTKRISGAWTDFIHSNNIVLT